MRFTVAWVLIITALIEVCGAEEPVLKIPTGLKTNAEFLLHAAEAMAEQQDALDLGFLYDREPRAGNHTQQRLSIARWDLLRDPPPEMLPEPVLDLGSRPNERNLVPKLIDETKRVELSAMRPGPWKVEELRPLLKHKDAKVRTLGVVLLYQLNRCDVLPELAVLASDDAPTFPSVAIGRAVGEPIPYQEQKVSDFVGGVFSAWKSASAELSTANYSVRTTPIDVLEEFVKKRHPTLNTAALVVAMQRMHAATSPVPGDRRQRIDQFLWVLDKIEQPRKFFVANSLGFGYFTGTDRYASDYSVRLAREVPRELRLKAVFGERPIDDPDLKNTGSTFFREHAVELFLAADAERFLALTQNFDGTRDHAEYVENLLTAAQLLPPRQAEPLLLEGLKKLVPSPDQRYLSDYRERIAPALVLLGNDKGEKAALDWFFATIPDRSTYGGGRELFLGRINHRDPTRYRQIVEKIIRDERFKQCGIASTRNILESVQGYLGRKLVTDEDYRGSFGYPESEIDRRYASLSKWHDLLKDTVDEWSRESKKADAEK